MPIILAIEPDRRQAAHLAGAVRQRVAAELILAETTEEALDAIGNRVPDMVLVPALLSPQEDAALAAALRLMATAAHVRMLTIPVLANGTKRTKPGGLLAKFRRGRADSPALDGCDPSVFADQINAYLQEAAADRAALQLENGDEAEPWLAPTDADEPIAIAVTRTIEAPTFEPITFAEPEPMFLATPEPIAFDTPPAEAWAIEPIEVLAEEPIAFAAPDPIVLATPEPIAFEAPPMEVWATEPIEAPEEEPIVFAAPDPIVLATPEPIAFEAPPMEAWAIEPIEVPEEEPIVFAAPDPIVLATPDSIAFEAPPMEAWAIEPIEVPEEEPIVFAAPDPIVLATPDSIAFELPEMEAWAIEPIEVPAEEPIVFAAPDPIVLATPEPTALETPRMEAWAIEPIVVAAPKTVRLATPQPTEPAEFDTDAWVIDLMETFSEEPVPFATSVPIAPAADEPIPFAELDPIEAPTAFAAVEPVAVVSPELDLLAAELDLWATTESIEQLTAAAFVEEESPAESDAAPEPNPDGQADNDLSVQLGGLAKELERLATLAPHAGASTPGPTAEADGCETPPLYVFDIEEYFVQAPVVQAPVVQASVVQASVVQAPVVQTPVVQAPVVQAPPMEDLVLEEFILYESEVEALPAETLAVAGPAAARPVVEEHIVEPHIVEDMTMEEEETTGSDGERWAPMHLTPGRMWPDLQGIQAEAAPPPNASPARAAERSIAAPGRAAVAQPKARTGAAPRADHPEWHELIASLRQDIARRRSDPVPVAAPSIAARSADAGAGNVKRRVKKQKPFGRKPRPLQDEWGLFDPDQCGFSALLAKLEEITSEESDGRRPS